ncbi:transposon ty3-g gag-pol polyprotein isoform x2 [Lasius niger]|uniref:Transposon ty3-g gag-pol polyprotein isoform x2 n=1 Tax=Lasius niger TaxID=67767 RepID=A0A0J7L5S2_LASNI|nr:transposon ty3-g gag-pol polyprotein isoform x2 [Lasius niger]KMQ98332.1 transposon ty3-g gag-pol polyprotein isoform x2 [Lasius niger]
MAGKRQCKLNIIEKVPIPFHTIHVDHVGPFETSSKNNKFLFVLVDAFTKFTIIEPVKSQKACYVVKILTNLIYLFEVPHRIISDRGTAFTSQAFRMFCDSYGIKHVLNAVATPRANG